MGYESIAHEAKGHEGKKNNCFSKIQLVGQKHIKTKHLALSLVNDRLYSLFADKTIQIWQVLFATSRL